MNMLDILVNILVTLPHITLYVLSLAMSPLHAGGEQRAHSQSYEWPEVLPAGYYLTHSEVPQAGVPRATLEAQRELSVCVWLGLGHHRACHLEGSRQAVDEGGWLQGTETWIGVATYVARPMLKPTPEVYYLKQEWSHTKTCDK